MLYMMALVYSLYVYACIQCLTGNKQCPQVKVMYAPLIEEITGKQLAQSHKLLYIFSAITFNCGDMQGLPVPPEKAMVFYLALPAVTP